MSWKTDSKAAASRLVAAYKLGTQALRASLNGAKRVGCPLQGLNSAAPRPSA
jgi:hypothetical protein